MVASINSVAIVGGTHGNEYSGIYLLKHWQKNPALIQRDSFATTTLLANPNAYRDNKRYLDCDLNRQFKLTDLANPELAGYEANRAKVINATIGPKGDSQTDLVIDLHNTTSNMGPSIIFPENGEIYDQMAAYVKMQMPVAVIVKEDDDSGADTHYLCNIGKLGVIVEVGPQPQSVLRQDILEWMDELTGHILDFVHLYNTKALPKLPAETDAYFYTETIKLPMDEKGERIGMVHKHVQDNDFKPLNPGDPLFKLFTGEEVYYQGNDTVYPHFINEAAYYDNNLAMSFAVKHTIRLKNS